MTKQIMRRYNPSLQGTVFLLVGLVCGLIIGTLSSNFLNLSNKALYEITQGNSAQIWTSPSSHEEVNVIDALNAARGWEPSDLERDSPSHHDDDSLAKQLYEQVRVLVFVETYPANLDTKARQVNNTWGKRANKLLFASDGYDPKYPTMNISVETGRGHLTAKTMRAFDYIYKNYLNEYDWFMKADDDTYVIMENLRYFLSNEDPDEPVFFGHWFKTKVEQGYYSGGGGYVISREALRRFGQRKPNACKNDTGSEDVAFGHCMYALGVTTKHSIDNMGRSRFHALNPKRMLKGSFPGWYKLYDKYEASHKGVEGLSDYAITFHYCSADVMEDLEYYVYHLKPYGIRTGIQKLNVDYSKGTPEKYESEQNSENTNPDMERMEPVKSDTLQNSGVDNTLINDKPDKNNILIADKIERNSGKDGTLITDNRKDNSAEKVSIQENPPVGASDLSGKVIKLKDTEGENVDKQTFEQRNRAKQLSKELFVQKLTKSESLNNLHNAGEDTT